MPCRGSHACRGETVLESEWNAVQQPPRFAARERFVGESRPLQSAFRVERDDRVERRIAATDTGQISVDDFARRYVATADGGSKLAGRSVNNVVHAMTCRPWTNAACSSPISITCGAGRPAARTARRKPSPAANAWNTSRVGHAS